MQDVSKKKRSYLSMLTIKTFKSNLVVFLIESSDTHVSVFLAKGICEKCCLALSLIKIMSVGIYSCE